MFIRYHACEFRATIKQTARRARETRNIHWSRARNRRCIRRNLGKKSSQSAEQRRRCCDVLTARMRFDFCRCSARGVAAAAHAMTCTRLSCCRRVLLLPRHNQLAHTYTQGAGISSRSFFFFFLTKLVALRSFSCLDISRARVRKVSRYADYFAYLNVNSVPRESRSTGSPPAIYFICTRAGRISPQTRRYRSE